MCFGDDMHPLNKLLSAFGIVAIASILPAADSRLTTDTLQLWRLAGGGEVVGSLVKETPRQSYVDVGPTVIELPADSIVSRTRLSELQEQTVGGIGLGKGTFDPATGSVFFRGREASAGMKSQREIIEDVKRGVVLVSNPGGLGTGWLYGTEGKLVTNHHVVGQETYQTVTMFVKNGNQWEKKRIENCKVEAFSDLLDIAIVQLDMEKVRSQNITLYPLTIAPPGSLEAGDAVFAVGNPGMGGMVLDHTVSEGIVSSLARNFGDIIYLQTTAAVNPGNSGGPLINARGEVIGLITLKAIFQEGVAFALPVDYVHHFLGHADAFAVSDSNRLQGFRYLRPE
jgi:serine protease Do